MTMKLNGKPFIGYLQLTNAASAMTAIPIFTVGKSGAYTLSAGTTIVVNGTNTIVGIEQQVLTSVLISSNDSAFPLVQLDNGPGGTVHILGSYYVGIGASSGPTTVPDYFGQQGAVGTPGIAIRAGVPGGITAAKTVEVTIRGYITAS